MKFLRCLAVFIMLLLQACATEEDGTAYYVNEMGEVSVAADDLTSELQWAAGGMVNAMLPTVLSGENMRHPSRRPAGVKPLAVIAELDNRTEEFVASGRVAEAIRRALRSHGALRVLDGELPRAEAPEREMLRLHAGAAPRLWAIPDAAEPEAGTEECAASAPERGAPPPASETGEPAGTSLLAASPALARAEPESRKKESLRCFLETRLKEAGASEEGALGHAPIYVIETVLLPLAAPPAGQDGKKEPYLLKMFVEEIRSGTIKWANAREVRKAASLSNFVENRSVSSFRAPETPGSVKSAPADAAALSGSDIREVTGILRDIGALREALQQ